MTIRVDRLYDESDSGDCVRCGECCIVTQLESMPREKAEKVGLEFCYELPRIKAFRKKDGKEVIAPIRYGLKKVKRNWQPKFALDGVCVFLYKIENEMTCMAREVRPDFCKKFNCVSTLWAAKMDWKVSEDKFSADKKSLSGDAFRIRYKEVKKAKLESDRFDNYLKEKGVLY